MKRPSGFDRLPGQQGAGEEPADPTPVEDSAPASTRRLRGVLDRFQSEQTADLEPVAEHVYRAEPDPVADAERQLREAARQVKAQQRRESRRFSAHSRRRRRNWFIVLGTVAALALFVAVGVFTPLMSVRQVQVDGVTSAGIEDVKKALSEFEGVPLALVRDSAVHDALEPFSWIERYSIEVIPPSTLQVHIEERVPVLSVKQGKSFQLYDAAGVLLGKAEAPPAGVPLASGAAANRESKAFAAAARVLRDMPAELRAQVVSVTASSGQDVTLVLTTGVEVMWGDAEHTKRKAVVLSSMLGALGDRSLQRIDVSSTEAPVFQ